MNFLSLFSVRELWNTCARFGTIVDVFIANKKSNVGKLFAFVRFIKVDDVEVFIVNLCMICIRRVILYVYVTQFEKNYIA